MIDLMLDGMLAEKYDNLMKAPAHLLFLCTGNSCRSQMAEGFARALGAGRVEARSAGIEAHGKNPRAMAVMREAGAVISTQVSVYALVAIVKKELQLDASSIP